MVKSHQRTERHVQSWLLLLALIAGIVGVSLAQGFTGLTGAATADVSPFVKPYIEMYNAKMDKGLPDIVITPFGDRVVTIHITDLGRSFYAVVKRGKLTSLEEGVAKNPTTTIWLDYATLTALQYKDITFDDAVQQGRISLSSEYLVRADLDGLVLESIDT